MLIGLSLPRLSFDDDIHRVFLSDSPLSQTQRAYDAAQDPPLSTVLIYISAPVPFDAQALTDVRNLSLDLEFLEGVTAVASPFVLRWPPTEDARSGTPLFGRMIDPGYASDLKAFDALNTGLPTFINDTRTALLLGVSIDRDATSVAQAVEALEKELARLLPSDLTAHLTGEDVISAEIVLGLKDDLIALNIWGALIVTLAALVLLRDLRMTLVAVLPALLGAAGVLMLSVWLGYPITVLSNVIPILLLVLGVADGVHLASHLKRDGSALSAVQTVGPACALTALTTAIAFASLGLTGNAQLFEFAVLGALGTLFSFGIVIVAFALLARVVPLSSKPVPQISAVIAQHLVTAGTARPRRTVVLCALLLAIASMGFIQTKAWFPLYQNLPGSSATMATNDAIAADFGGVFQMIVETSGSWEQTRDLVTKLETLNGPKTVLSDVSLARWMDQPDTRPSKDATEPLPRALIDQFRVDNDTLRLFISLPEPMRSAEGLAHFDRVYETAFAGGTNHAFGLPVIMRQEAVTLIRQLSFGLVVAVMGATLLCALAFRSIRMIPVLIMPNLLPMMITGASLHLWAQGQLSPTAVLALTIAFGMAIDDTVHFLSRYADASAKGATPNQAVTQAAGSAGQVMLLTTLLLTFGLCVTLVSDFAPIRLFGGMMIVTLWAAALIDLLLLPALLTWKKDAHGSG